MKVVFLDFDGVLNSLDFFRRDPGPFDRLDPLAVARLNTLVQRSGAKVIISSSWRLQRPLEDIRHLLLQLGFMGEVAGSTADLSSSAGIADCSRVRCLEIRSWLERSAVPVERFVVLDDTELDDLVPHLVRTTFDTGLRDEHVDEAVDLLATRLHATPGGK